MDEKIEEMDVMIVVIVEIVVIIEVPVVGEEVVVTGHKLLTDQDHSSL